MLGGCAATMTSASTSGSWTNNRVMHTEKWPYTHTPFYVYILAFWTCVFDRIPYLLEYSRIYSSGSPAYYYVLRVLAPVNCSLRTDSQNMQSQIY